MGLSERWSVDKQTYPSHHFEWGTAVWWIGLITDLQKTKRDTRFVSIWSVKYFICVFPLPLWAKVKFIENTFWVFNHLLFFFLQILTACSVSLPLKLNARTGLSNSFTLFLQSVYFKQPRFLGLFHMLKSVQNVLEPNCDQLNNLSLLSLIINTTSLSLCISGGLYNILLLLCFWLLYYELWKFIKWLYVMQLLDSSNSKHSDHQNYGYLYIAISLIFVLFLDLLVNDFLTNGAHTEQCPRSALWILCAWLYSVLSKACSLWSRHCLHTSFA